MRKYVLLVLALGVFLAPTAAQAVVEPHFAEFNSAGWNQNGNTVELNGVSVRIGACAEGITFRGTVKARYQGDIVLTGVLRGTCVEPFGFFVSKNNRALEAIPCGAEFRTAGVLRFSDGQRIAIEPRTWTVECT